VVSGQWSVVSGQWSVVSGQWSVAGKKKAAILILEILPDLLKIFLNSFLQKAYSLVQVF
jgi:hypothetical protein